MSASSALPACLGLLLLCGCQEERPVRVVANVPFVESNIHEIQAVYQQHVADMEAHMQEVVAVRGEIAALWDFAIQEERSHRMEQAVAFFHTHDPEQRLQTLRQQRDAIQQQLTQLDTGQKSSLVRNWHRGSKNLLAHYSALVDGSQSLGQLSQLEFTQQTITQQQAFQDDLAAVRSLLDSPLP